MSGYVRNPTKFSHMFYKPVADFQKRGEEANGSSNLPPPSKARKETCNLMPTFVYTARCDGCGQCVDICPSDIMHIDPVYLRWSWKIGQGAKVYSAG